ncbi:MAG: hypothetical protein HYZ26_12135 [Chloroflexi bacterium]|nr:hypothetical protein [Chloroflexota bacterium]
MRNIYRFTSLLLTLAFLLVACDGAAPDPAALEATIQAAATGTLGAQLAETLVAQATENAFALAVQATLDASATFAANQTATAQALITPTVTPPPTLAGVGHSGPPDLTLITLAEMNCRFGPATGWAVKQLLPAGQTYPILGRNSDSSWVKIQTGAGECWLAVTSNIDPSGDISLLALAPTPGLPTNTAAPTQAPGLRAGRAIIVDCDGRNFIAVPVESTGGLTFQSGSIAVTRVSDSKQVGYRDSNNLFGASQNSCGGGNASLGPGQLGWVTVLVQTPATEALRIIVTLCTEPGQKGDCYKQAINFNP